MARIVAANTSSSLTLRGRGLTHIWVLTVSKVAFSIVSKRGFSIPRITPARHDCGLGRSRLSHEQFASSTRSPQLAAQPGDPMRTVTYGAACSLDGFITARDGAIDWLKWSPDVSAIMEEYWKGVDAMLFGRKTWDFAQASGGSGGEGSDRGAFASVASYLFSRTIKKVPP